MDYITRISVLFLKTISIVDIQFIKRAAADFTISMTFVILIYVCL